MIPADNTLYTVLSFRCSQAKDIWEAVAAIGNTSASNHVRDSAIETLRAQKDFIRKMKCLKALLDIVPQDKVQFPA